MEISSALVPQTAWAARSVWAGNVPCPNPGFAGKRYTLSKLGPMRAGSLTSTGDVIGSDRPGVSHREPKAGPKIAVSRYRKGRYQVDRDSRGSAGNEPDPAAHPLIIGASSVAALFATPAGENAAMVKVGVVEAKPIESEPAKEGVELRQDPAPAPRHARERPTRPNVSKIDEVGPKASIQAGSNNFRMKGRRRLPHPSQHPRRRSRVRSGRCC